MEMPRIIIFAIMLGSAVAVKAQSPLSFAPMNGVQTTFRDFHQPSDTSAFRSKWFMTRYVGISTSFIRFPGGNGTFLSAPVGLRLNRQLTNNVYAFAGLQAAPSYLQFNNAFYQSKFNGNSGFMNANNFGAISTAELGLMYINSEKTFSISGSIGVSRGYYNPYMPLYAPANGSGARNNQLYR